MVISLNRHFSEKDIRWAKTTNMKSDQHCESKKWQGKPQWGDRSTARPEWLKMMGHTKHWIVCGVLGHLFTAQNYNEDFFLQLSYWKLNTFILWMYGIHTLPWPMFNGCMSISSPKTCTRRSKMTQFITIRGKKLHWWPSEEMHKLWHSHKIERPTAMTVNTCIHNTNTALSEWQWTYMYINTALSERGQKQVWNLCFTLYMMCQNRPDQPVMLGGRTMFTLELLFKIQRRVPEGLLGGNVAIWPWAEVPHIFKFLKPLNSKPTACTHFCTHILFCRTDWKPENIWEELICCFCKKFSKFLI